MAYFGLPVLIFLVGLPIAAGVIFLLIFAIVRACKKKKAAKKKNDSADI